MSKKAKVNHGDLTEASRRIMHEILWDRFRSEYGGHRTWVIVKVGENKRVHTWITIRELMKIMEESYEKN